MVVILADVLIFVTKFARLATMLALLYVVPPDELQATPLAQNIPLLTCKVLADITLAPVMLPYAPVVVILATV